MEHHCIQLIARYFFSYRILKCVSDAANVGIQGTLNELKDMETTVNKTVTIMKSLGEGRNRI